MAKVKVNTLRGSAPDYDNGGQLIDGMIVGPKVSSCRWQIDGEKRVFTSREEVDTEIKRRILNEELYAALGLSEGIRYSSNDIISIVKKNHSKTKVVLGSRKYAPLLG